LISKVYAALNDVNHTMGAVRHRKRGI